MKTDNKQANAKRSDRVYARLTSDTLRVLDEVVAASETDRSGYIRDLIERDLQGGKRSTLRALVAELEALRADHQIIQEQLQTVLLALQRFASAPVGFSPESEVRQIESVAALELTTYLDRRDRRRRLDVSSAWGGANEAPDIPGSRARFGKS